MKIVERTSTEDLDFESDPNRYDKLMANSETFDYRDWLSKNEEDLENLFTYLDAYCAEYEANNK